MTVSHEEMINAAKSRASFFNRVSLRTVLLSGSDVWPDLRLYMYMAVHGERRCINIYTCLEINLEICSRVAHVIWMKSILQPSKIISIESSPQVMAYLVYLNIKINYSLRNILLIHRFCMSEKLVFLKLYVSELLFISYLTLNAFASYYVFINIAIDDVYYIFLFLKTKNRWHTAFHAWKLITMAIWKFVVLLYYKVLMYRIVAYNVSFLYKRFSNNIRKNKIYIINEI